MTASSFSVSGQRVVVVGAARSGVAAAELLVRRGASVTLTDMRDLIVYSAAASLSISKSISQRTIITK